MKTDSKEPIKIDFSAMSRAELEEFASQKSNLVIALEAENNHYKELLRRNRSNMFGFSSERYISEGQLSLFNEAEKEAEPDSKEPEKSEALPPPKQKKSKGHKKELVKHLPKETVEYTLTDDERICPKCGSGLEGMTTVVRTEIEVIPEKYKVVEHRTKVYSCKACDKEGTEGTIVAASSPGGMFRNSLASPGMVANIIFKKYALAQPLYRQEQELSRIGIAIGRNTLANWVIKGAFKYLMPVREHMKGILSKGGVVQVDETSVQVLNEPGRAATAQSYMWAYRSGRYEERQIILFDYSPGRGAEYPKAFLEGFKGYLLCDGYQVYRVVAQGDGTGPPGIILSACWDHARRKYTDIIKGLAKNVTIKGTDVEKALEYIGELYKIEEKVRGKPPEERFKYREEYATPIVDKYFKWLKTIRDECTESLGTAVNYSLNQEKDLRVYLEDGRLDNSNCLCENAIRPFCVGRRNWLFSDTQDGAEASAACYGIIETAKANGIDPLEYLRYIFTIFKDSDIGSLKLDDFMPWSPSLPDACRKSEGAENLAS
jgi:transposase